MRKIPDLQDCFEQGYNTYEVAKTPEEALAIRPYKPFGHGKLEHAKAVSWNRGWNTAKMEDLK